MSAYRPNTCALIFDLETVIDEDLVRKAYKISDPEADAVTAAFGDRFPPPAVHAIVAIAACRMRLENGAWSVEALGTVHCGDRPERELIRSFVASINEHSVSLVGFNSLEFDLNVLRYRCLFHKVPAPGLAKRKYFYRYGGFEDHLDLCDCLSSYNARSRITLNATCAASGIPGKSEGIDGSQVGELIATGQFSKLASYATRDALCTAGLWLRYQLFTGSLTEAGYDQSLRNISQYIGSRKHQFDPVQFGDFLMTSPAAIAPQVRS